ncbi:MAG: hypothetical protein HUN05_02585 [Desulfobacter sp.]|nr:MAG: hypothetical protein HUN05_02585 [Desulfobacter sp.]
MIVIGERRKYLTAMFNLNPDQAVLLAQKQGIAFEDPDDLLDNKAFLKIVADHVAERNSQLARYETIKKYRILIQAFSSETGELTASLKLKRNVVMTMYEDLVESMYADAN